MTALAAALPAVPVRRWLDRLATVALIAAALLLLALAASLPAGYRVLIDRSDSMRPSIAAGDVVVTDRSRPEAVGEGDIVTFAHPERRGETLTHRVVETSARGSRVSFVTRGDANSGVERWSIDRSGTLGRYVARVPKVGYAVAWLAVPAVRFVCIVLTALLLGGLSIRWIWRS